MKKIKGKSIIKSIGKKKKPVLRKLAKTKKASKAVKKAKIKTVAKKSTALVKKIKKSVAIKSNKLAKKSKTASKSKSAVIKKAKVNKSNTKPKAIKKIIANRATKLTSRVTKKLKSYVVAKAVSASSAQIKKTVITTPTKKAMQKVVSTSSPMGVKSYMPAKNEMYMSTKQIEHFKIILNIWKEQLMAEMNRTVQHMKTYAANFPDPVDRASQEEDFNLELKTRERERKLIKKIDEALEKIQGGDYGFCMECGAEIGIKRLEARPTASQCIECKTIAEIREKQTGG